MVKVHAEPAAGQTATTAGTNMSSCLSLRHTYMPKLPVDFAGPTYFGERDDQLVLCAAKGTCPLQLFLELTEGTHMPRNSRGYSHLGPRIWRAAA
jgi:hypothetical protein